MKTKSSTTPPNVSSQRSLLGRPLNPCSSEPMTGFFRTGCCETGAEDLGRHVVCVQVTAEFLAFSVRRGNDLTTPQAGFPGLRPGDRWCVCALRWQEAYEAGVAPPVVLAATHESVTDVVDRAALLACALDSHELN